LTDACGNTSETTRSFNVLSDTEGPVFDAQPAQIADISCNDILPTQVTLTATDACGTANVVASGRLRMRVVIRQKRLRRLTS